MDSVFSADLELSDFQDVGSFGLSAMFLDLLVFQGLSDVWFFGYGSGLSFRILVVFRLLDSVWFFGSDRCRLLIQRWKRERGIRNFFDKGWVLPDESEVCPTKGKWGCRGC